MEESQQEAMEGTPQDAVGEDQQGTAAAPEVNAQTAVPAEPAETARSRGDAGRAGSCR